MLISESRTQATSSPILSMGFRPFFFSGGLVASLAIPVWLMALLWDFNSSPPISWYLWHIHEMLFGFVLAVIVGFLTTAVPKWTHTQHLSGKPLLLLWLLWIAIRFAALLLPANYIALFALAFWAVLITVISAPIIRTRNQRNYKVAAIIIVLASLQLLFLLNPSSIHITVDLALWLVVLLVLLVGTRILPSFTINGLSQHFQTRLPPPTPHRGRHIPSCGVGAIFALTAARTLFDLGDLKVVLAVVAAISGIAVFYNLSRWRCLQTRHVPLLWSLHAGYGFVGLGLLLLSTQSFIALPSSAITHTISAGAMGMMIAAMITRVSKGHSGRALLASRADCCFYALVLSGALIRILAALLNHNALLSLGAVLWSVGFLIFTVAYIPTLWGTPK